MATEIKTIHTALHNIQWTLPNTSHSTWKTLIQICLFRFTLIYLLVRMASNIWVFFVEFLWLPTFWGQFTPFSYRLICWFKQMVTHTYGSVSCLHLAPRAKPHPTSALLMEPTLTMLWWSLSINCSGLVWHLLSVYRFFMWQWQI